MLEGRRKDDSAVGNAVDRLTRLRGDGEGVGAGYRTVVVGDFEFGRVLSQGLRAARALTN